MERKKGERASARTLTVSMATVSMSELSTSMMCDRTRMRRSSAYCMWSPGEAVAGGGGPIWR